MSAPQVASASAVSASPFRVRVDFDQAMVQSTAFYDFASWTIPGATISEVSSEFGDSTALLTLAGEMRTGAEMTVTVSPTLTCAATFEAMDMFHLSANFDGLGVAPSIVSVTAVDPHTVHLTFSEAIAVTSVSISRGLVALANSSVEVSGGTTVVVKLSEEMLDGADYLASWTVEDLVGNSSTDRSDFIGLGGRPTVTSFELVGSLLRINFSEEMKRDSALRSRFSYAVRAMDSGSAAVHIERVVSIDSTHVILELSPMTGGASYEIGINGPTDLAGNSMDPSGDTAEFTGTSEATKLLEVRAIGPNLIDAIFSAPIKDNASLREVSRWQFDLGVNVLQVIPDLRDRRVVHLAVDGWIPGVEYTLTLDPS